MNKFLIVLFLFIVSFSVNDVQKEYISLDWQIPEKKEILVAMPVLNNADYFPDDTNLPYFSKLYDLENKNQDVRVVVEDFVFEEIEIDEELKEDMNFPEKIEVETSHLKSGDIFKLSVRFIPIIQQEHKVFLLKNFSIREVPVETKSAELEMASENTWAEESVLKSGNWVKIKTSGKGIYRIPYSTLNEWGFTNPQNVNVYGSGGEILSENPAEIEYDDLVQDAVWHSQSGGTDCLFFYEPGNTKWKPDNEGNFLEHSNNSYSNNGYYFLTEDIGNQKLVEQLAEVTEEPTHTISNFNEYRLYEKDETNLISSGKQWFGEKFSNGHSENFNFDLTDIEVSGTVSLKVNSAARSYQSSSMRVNVSSDLLGSVSFQKVNTDDAADLFAYEKSGKFTTTVDNQDLQVQLRYTGNSNAVAWLDYIEINYRRELILTNGELFFRDLQSVGPENFIEFTVKSTDQGTRVFDVTDSNNLKEIPVSREGNLVKGVRPADRLYEYVAFNSTGTFKVPELVGEVENQNLHSLSTPDFLIITHPNFLGSANELADFHKAEDGLDVKVVVSDKIYNEFSSGRKDATGIRNFIKMFYDRGEKLKYVLLFGDGNYDNKNYNGNGLNFIPTFQSANSLNPVGSFVTDDYYVILDENESVYDGAVDLGIGRIPASTQQQANTVVNKIKRYYSPEALGNWRNIVCFIGDDGDGNLHMWDSERLATRVNENHSEFITDKIYFDAYVQETTTSGEEYPDVNKAINKRVHDGVLILNYVGHANDRFLADEHVLDVSDINSWSNSNTMPIFVTATCEFSRFDSDEISAGEYVLFNASGGGIGLFSTTRFVISGPNYLLSRSFYDHVFQLDENGEHYRMGDVMRLAKINTSNSTNKRNFSLLADPALKLSYPAQRVITTSVNQQNVEVYTDTIGALETITVNGYIADYQGNKLDNFSGHIIPSVYDKAVTMQTLANEGGTPLEFKVQENLIYKGLASVSNGEFSFSFVVPKDIMYSLGNGKIIYYAENGETDANGAFENFVIGGSGSQVSDNEGPEIRLYMDSESFVSGGETTKNPTLLAFLSDDNGINTTGVGLGHDITAVLDEDYSHALALNEYYQADVDNYKSGSLQYPLKDISPGMHTLKLKAWDVANNSTEVQIEFMVSEEFIISQVSCYPNPMIDYTYFTFTHNQSGAVLETIVEIFNLQGQRIDYFETRVGSNGNESNPILWDTGALKVSIRNGIYICKVTARNNNGVITSKSGKFIVSD